MTTFAPFSSALPAGRQRYLALGRHYAAAIAAIQADGLEAAVAVAATMGGARQKKSIARGLVAAIRKSPCRFPAYRIEPEADGRHLVYIPTLTWRWRGDRQVGEVEWLPMFGTRALPRRPLP